LLEPVTLAELTGVWESLGFPPIVQVPHAPELASMARFNLPIVIGRSLIRVEKASGRWRVSLRDVRSAAADLAALHTADVRGHVVLEHAKRGWQAKLVTALDNARLRELDDRQDAAPDAGSWFWSAPWGFLDLSSVARRRGHQWSVPEAYVAIIEAGQAQQRTALAQRGVCVRCGGAVKDFYDHAIRTGRGWDALCPACHATHVDGLRDYDGHLRDIPYARSQYRKNDPALKYRCVVCSQPASAWDHCHEHGYIRGPLCARCNANDGWLGNPYSRQPRPPLEHINRCKGCAQVGPSLETRAALIGLMLFRAGRGPVSVCHRGAVRFSFPDRVAIRAAIARQPAPLPPAIWSCTQCESRWELDLRGALPECDRRAFQYLRDGEPLRDPAPDRRRAAVKVAATAIAPRRSRPRPTSVPAQIRYLVGQRRDGAAQLARTLGVSERTIKDWLDGRAPSQQNRSRLQELVDAKISQNTRLLDP
jgi:recombination endonuclease VII